MRRRILRTPVTVDSHALVRFARVILAAIALAGCTSIGPDGGRESAWTPDGESVQFIAPGMSTGRSPGSGRPRAVRHAGPAHGNREGRWSPDGGQIVTGTGDLWLMEADRSDAHTVLEDGALDFEASFTPSC